MLFDQLEAPSKRTAVSKIGLGPSAARFESSSQTEALKGLYSRLRTVEEALQQDPGIASIQRADLEMLPAYCRDTGLWNAALISKTYDVSTDVEWASSYCLLRDCGDVLVLLVGSQHNLTGSVTPTAASVSPSFTVDEYLLNVSEEYWQLHKEATALYDAEIDEKLMGVLHFCGSSLTYTPPRMLKILFRVFSIFEIQQAVLEETYARSGGSCIFTGTPSLLVTGSPLYVALAN